MSIGFKILKISIYYTDSLYKIFKTNKNTIFSSGKKMGLNLAKRVLHLFYSHLEDTNLINSTLIKYIVWQKILGINRHVPWPVHFTSEIKSPKKITNGLKETPGYSMSCYIDARNGIILEDNVYFGPRVSLISMNHNLNNLKEYTICKPIIIRKNSWLATNCIILAGVELGEHTIVAAGAVVTKSFPEGNQLLAGNPAIVIKKILKTSISTDL